MKKNYLLAFTLTLLFITAKAQSPFRLSSEFSQEQQSEYSKFITLLQKSTLFGRIASGDSLTILLSPDFSLSGVENTDTTMLFKQNYPPVIEDFIAHYSLPEMWNSERIQTRLSTNASSFALQNRSSENFDFSKNGDLIMITTSNGFEANIAASIRVKNTIIHLLTGLLK